MLRILNYTHARALALAAGLLVLTGCGASSVAASARSTASSTASPSAHAASSPTVVIRSFKYQPKVITVSRGTTVTFANHDNTNHTVTADRGAFNLGNFNRGQSHRFRFTRAGTYKYHCTYHPFMHGTVVVR